MGEVEGEGMLMRWELTDGEAGVVGGPEDDDAEPDDVDETESERGLFREPMGMGTE